MVYLVNQRCPDIEMEYMTDTDVIPKLKQAFKEESLSVILDETTSDKLNQKLPFTLPDFDEKFAGESPDDVVVTLPDNLELGDEIIAVEEHGSFLMYYGYTQWD